MIIINDFDSFLNETDEWWKKAKKIISEEEFNSLQDKDMGRFILGYNDGQGDHRFMTYDEMIKLLENSERQNKTDLKDMTRTQIVDEIYKELDLNGNNSEMVYFDGTKFLRIEWK